jgi:hypothetical protein
MLTEDPEKVIKFPLARQARAPMDIAFHHLPQNVIDFMEAKRALEQRTQAEQKARLRLRSLAYDAEDLLQARLVISLYLLIAFLMVVAFVFLYK